MLHDRLIGPLRTPAFLAALLIPALAAPAGVSWRSDYAKALHEAKSSGKLLLVNVHATWCGPCRQLQATTLQDAKLAEVIHQHCVPLSLDGDDNEALVTRWGIVGYPSQIFLDPRSGRVLGTLTGLVSAKDYAAAVRWAWSQSSIATSPAAPTQLVSDRAKAAEKPLAPAPADLIPPVVTEAKPADVSVPLALSGYCPVSMIARAELLAGDPRYATVYRGYRYHFLSDGDRRSFLENPERYLPAANGNCVVTWADERRWLPGQVRLPALFADQVYLFQSESQRKRFLLDPERYIELSAQSRVSAVR